MTSKRRHLMPAERQARIAYELCAIAPGAPWMLRRAAGLPLDTVVGQPLGLTRQQPQDPEEGNPE